MLQPAVQKFYLPILEARAVQAQTDMVLLLTLQSSVRLLHCLFWDSEFHLLVPWHVRGCDQNIHDNEKTWREYSQQLKGS